MGRIYLEKIVEHKRYEIKSLKLLKVERKKKILDPVIFLKEKPFITEVKKASPSMGDINTGSDILEMAQLYEKGGAGAISVLTDEKYFKGNLNFLSEIAKKVKVPVLCKDFILDEIQIENAYLAGADLILLIAAILNETELKSLSKKAKELNLKVLYELHNIEEFDKIKNLDLEIVGVNSRDLKTFQIDMKFAGSTIELLKTKGAFLKVAESGISERRDIKFFKKSGANAYLIGTSLMQSENPVSKLREFYNGLEL